MAALSIITTTSGALVIAATAVVSSFSLATVSNGALIMEATASLRNNSLITTSSGFLVIEATASLRNNSLVGQSHGQLGFSIAPTVDWGLVTVSAGHLVVSSIEDISTSMDWVMRGTTVKSRLRLNGPDGLTVFDAAREVYNLWKIEITDARDIEFARDRVLGYINNAVQTMHARAHKLDYFTRAPLTVTVLSGASSVALPETVQAVRGPVKIESSKLPLRSLQTRTELDLFAAYYFGDSPLPSEPRAYYLDSAHVSGPDNVAMTLFVCPPPGADTDIVLDVSHEPPRYDVGHIFNETPLQVPARFAETVFWPLLRYAAAGDTLFQSETLRPDIDSKFQRAQEILGLLNPPPPEAKPTKPTSA